MTNTYSYTNQISLLEKAKGILELKIRAIKRMDACIEHLKLRQKCFVWDPITIFPVSHYEHNVEIWTKAVEWLGKYYSRIAKQICDCLSVVEVAEAATIKKGSIHTVKLTNDVMIGDTIVLDFRKEVTIDEVAEQTEYHIPGWPYLPNHYGGLVEPVDLGSRGNSPD